MKNDLQQKIIVALKSNIEVICTMCREISPQHKNCKTCLNKEYIEGVIKGVKEDK